MKHRLLLVRNSMVCHPAHVQIPLGHDALHRCAVLNSPAINTLHLWIRRGSYTNRDYYANCHLEVARATDNLAKSGEIFGMHGRRDSLPLAFIRQYADFGESLRCIAPIEQS